MKDYIKRPLVQLVQILTGNAAKFGRTNCFPGHKTILKWLWERHGIRLSRRSLCRQLGGLERQGYFRRERRHIPKKGEGMIYRSTKYHLTQRAIDLSLKMRRLWGWRPPVDNHPAYPPESAVPIPAHQQLFNNLNNLPYPPRI